MAAAARRTTVIASGLLCGALTLVVLFSGPTAFRSPTAVLREKLLTVHGIGPETADAILLYAAKHPVFVVDAYTRRMLERHGLAEPAHSYEEIRLLFERSLPSDVSLYNEFHALIVRNGKEYCRTRNPRCSECPLHSLLPQTMHISL